MGFSIASKRIIATLEKSWPFTTQIANRFNRSIKGWLIRLWMFHGIYPKPINPLFWGSDPRKQGLVYSKRWLFGFQVSNSIYCESQYGSLVPETCILNLSWLFQTWKNGCFTKHPTEIPLFQNWIKRTSCFHDFRCVQTKSGDCFTSNTRCWLPLVKQANSSIQGIVLEGSSRSVSG